MVSSNPPLAYGSGGGVKQEIPNRENPLVVLFIQTLFVSGLGLVTAFVECARNIFHDYCPYLMISVLLGFVMHILIVAYPKKLGLGIKHYLMLVILTISYGLFYAVAASNYFRYASAFSIAIAWALTGLTMSTACVIPLDVTGLHGTVQMYTGIGYASLAMVFLFSAFITDTKVYALLFSGMSLLFYIFNLFIHAQLCMLRCQNVTRKSYVKKVLKIFKCCHLFVNTFMIFCDLLYLMSYR